MTARLKLLARDLDAQNHENCKKVLTNTHNAPSVVNCLVDDFHRRLDAAHELTRLGEYLDLEVVGSLGHLQHH